MPRPRHNPRLGFVLAAAAAVAVCCLPPPALAAMVDEPALDASGFVDSIGANVHMSYSNTPYRQVGKVRERLRALGVSHVRDGLRPERPDQWAALNELARGGIRTTLIMGGLSGASPAPELAALRANLLGAADAVEGVNEPDTNARPDWTAVLRAHQSAIYDGVKRDRATAWLPVIGPSLISGDTFGQLGDLTGALDFGNLHLYTGGQAPGDDKLVTENLDLARAVSGSKPVVITETGFHNATGTGLLGGRPAGQPGISEAAAAAYVPRTYLESYRRGIPRSYLYELVDEFSDPARREAESNFGLLRTDFSAKPAFDSLRNLIAVLRDPCGPRRARRLSYSVTSSVDVHRLLLGRRDGSLVLALWRPTSTYDLAARRDLPVAPAQVRVDFGDPVGNAEVVRPSLGTGAVAAQRSPAGVTVDLGADATLLRLTPPRSGFRVAAGGGGGPLADQVDARLGAGGAAAVKRLRKVGRRRLTRRRRFGVSIPAGLSGTVRAELRLLRHRRRPARLASRTAAVQGTGGRVTLRLGRRAARRLRGGRARRLQLSLALDDGGPGQCPFAGRVRLRR